MVDGCTRYSPVPGIPTLREAICAKLREDGGLATGADEVIVTAG